MENADNIKSLNRLSYSFKIDYSQLYETRGGNMFEAIDHITKSGVNGSIVSGNIPINKKTNTYEAPQKQQESQQENLQKIKGQKNISEEFLSELEKDIELMHQIRLKFSVHDATGRIIVKVINEDTGETIREVPSETILDMAANLDEFTGILSNDMV